MGNTSPAAPPREGPGFKVKYLGHAFVNDICEYEFFVEPPAGAAPGQLLRRSLDDLSKLSSAMTQRHPNGTPVPPPRPMFDTGAEGKAIEGYLRSLLALEPWPRSNALRQFLGIAMPPPPPSSTEAVSPMVLGHRVPMGALAILLSFCEASAALSVYSRVCKSFRAAALHPSVWPSLRLRSGVAERCIDSLCGILMSTCAGLQSLSLDLTFQQADLGIALPAELVLRQLSSLELTLGDPEANTFACDLLGCLDSPGLIDLKLCGVLTSQLLHALQMALSATLRSLSLTAAPERNSSSEVILDQGTVSALQDLLEATPAISNLLICVEDETGGLTRSLHSPLSSLGAPTLRSCMALRQLRKLHFDFLSDDVVAHLRHAEHRSWHLQVAKFSGCKRSLADPDQTLLTLLSKLGPDLEEFALVIDLELPIRPFARGTWGILHQRLGALPNVWQHHAALKTLELNWQAFDDEGVASLVECCPELEVLLLDRAEYWTDATIQRILNSLPSLQQLRVRSSPMMSDQTLHELQQAPPGLRILEIEPSYAMSTFMLDQLKATMSDDATYSTFSSFLAAELLGLQPVQRPGAPVQLRVLKPLEEESPSLNLWPQLTLGSRKSGSQPMYIGR